MKRAHARSQAGCHRARVCLAVPVGGLRSAGVAPLIVIRRPGRPPHRGLPDHPDPRLSPWGLAVIVC